MPTVRELTEPYGNFLLNPLRPSEEVCQVCLSFCYEGYTTCYSCGRSPRYADAVLPISYSPHLEQLHTALAGYKRLFGPPARKFQLDLAAVLWRFVDRHERCLARSLGGDAFDVVTTVPAGTAGRDEAQPLREIVGRTIRPTARRYERLLRRTSKEVTPHTVDLEKFEVLRDIDGDAVLLIDDTWTTGSNVQSAAGALKEAGAGAIGVVVVGRHVQRDFRDDGNRLNALPRPFDWEKCALEP